MTTNFDNTNNSKTDNVRTELESALDQPSVNAPDAPSVISVNVGIPGNIRRMTVPSGATVGDVLKAAEINASGYEVRVNNQTMSANAPVQQNQTILLLRPVVGNNLDSAITVNVGVPGNIRKVTLAPGQQTVGDALRMAEANANGYEVRVNNETKPLNAPVTDNQTILLLRPVVGNN